MKNFLEKAFEKLEKPKLDLIYKKKIEKKSLANSI